MDPKHVDIESLNQHAAELLSADGNSNQAMMIVETMDDINDRCAPKTHRINPERFSLFVAKSFELLIDSAAFGALMRVYFNMSLKEQTVLCAYLHDCLYVYLCV